MTETKIKPVRFCSVDLRDGQQSLLATRLKTEDIVPVISKMDKVGFDCIEVWGGATFDTCMRYLNEDPFERLRMCKKAAMNTPLRMFLRGQNLLGYKQYPDDVCEAFVEKAAEAGCDIFLIFDGIIDIRNCMTVMNAAMKAGKKVEGTLLYTTSPEHNDDLYVRSALEFEDAGATAVYLEDMAGMKDPTTVATTIRRIKERVSIPVKYHAHCLGGMAEICYWEAVKAGAEVLDTCFSAFSRGTAHPPLESIYVAFKNTPYKSEINMDLLSEINNDLKKLRVKYAQYESKFTGVDINVLKHQIPGGMMSNLEVQLKSMNAENRIDEILEEVVIVHADLGYPPLGTPFSQMVGVQSTINVMSGERYRTIPTEVRNYIMGKYGKIPGPINPELKEKVLRGENPITCRPADLLEPGLEEARKNAGDLVRTEEDLVAYAMFPTIAEEYLKNKYGL